MKIPSRPPDRVEPRDPKLWKTAQAFEAQFLKSMLEQAYAGLSGEGPLGGSGPGADAWRGFLIDEHAKGMAAKDGIGIAASVYRHLQNLNRSSRDVRI